MATLYTGTSGDDTIDGTIVGSSSIDGGAGNDFVGGSGSGANPADWLSGGEGNDTVLGAYGNDTLYGGEGNDSLYELQSSNLSPFPPPNNEDYLHGGPGNDTLRGGARDDSLFGGQGDDYLHGGSGDDSGEDYLEGGAGNDTLYDAGGVNTLSGGDGNDSMWDEDSSFSPSAVFNDLYLGGNGDDTIANAGISDTIVGGDGFDWVQFLNGIYLLVLGPGTSTTSLGAFTPLPQYDVYLSGIEGIISSYYNTSDDTIVGGDPNTSYWFIGGSGNDSLVGNAASDTLDGGDTYLPIDPGNDTLDGQGGFDWLDHSWTSGNGSIIANDSGEGSVGNDILRNIEGILGGSGTDTISAATDGDYWFISNAANDVLTTNAGNDTLNGGNGDDTMAGGLGNDLYYVSSNGDLITDTGGESDTVVVSINYSLDALEGIENLVLGGAATSGTGNALDNEITGNDLSNAIIGAEGDDSILGVGGNDVLQGNQGDDTLRGGLGSDELRGGQDDDVIFSGQGNDQVLGALGNDELRGGVGADTVSGGQGNDSLFGGADNDLLLGRLGNDTLSGGAGGDIFSFAAAGSADADTILDFEIGTDKIQLEAATFTQTTFGVNVLYNAGTGALSYDADGAGAGSAVLIATLTGAPAFTASDLLVL